MKLTEREKQYDIEELKSSIESAKENIKTFEQAIERELARIKKYRQIIIELGG